MPRADRRRLNLTWLPGRKNRALIVDDETYGLDRVKEVQPLFYGDHVVILQNGARLNLSRNFRSRLAERLRRGAGG